MLIVRTAAEIRNEVAKLPLVSPENVSKFIDFEVAYEAGRVKGYLRGKVLPVRAIHGEWRSEALDAQRAMDARIVAVADMIAARLRRQLA